MFENCWRYFLVKSNGYDNCTSIEQNLIEQLQFFIYLFKFLGLYGCKAVILHNMCITIYMTRYKLLSNTHNAPFLHTN